ncbi:MAG: hypothetical protein J6A75_02590 [Lachnospiraceae bacterium]|nr:hypothetical protein [Lachnospiraceae bacterium]
MIDETKIKTELQELIKSMPEGTLQNRIYSIVLEYINRQPVITLAQIRFEQRIAAVWLIWSLVWQQGKRM